MNFGAELEKALRHLLAKAGAPAGHQNAFSVHQAGSEHELVCIHDMSPLILRRP